MDLRRWVLVLAGTVAAAGAPGVFDSASLKNIANVSYASPSELSSLFAPRMDFEQWKPLTGRGDPLRNDPTYDYEPPQLERVHYWADEPRKSEVLVLGVSSRKPSAAQRPTPPRRHYRPTPIKYEDFSYKISEHYPMTILVPPPPPPPGHKLPLFILTEEKLTTPNQPIRTTERPTTISEQTADPSLTSLYALQEANLIYQSSTTSQNWILNHTKPILETSVSSDYAGWGPTTPIDDEDSANETHNFIFNDHYDISMHPYSFYRPMLSEAPPPPQNTPTPLLLPTFVPTALPPTTARPTPASSTTTVPPDTTTQSYLTETDLNMNEELTTDSNESFRPTPLPPDQTQGFLGMFSSMLSMPMVTGPERPEDNLYAHASENLHVYHEHPIDETTLESMQTMQPPPPSKTTESTTIMHKTPFHVNALPITRQKATNTKTLDPYLHMRFTTPPPMPTLSTNVEFEAMTTTEAATIPPYLIIQGHSKVKTYSSKNKSSEVKEASVNELPKPNETNEVKHLHPKDKNVRKVEKIDKRAGRAQNLQTLINEGFGSIEIQEANVGIKYDVSDGSEVPLEIYRKGIVENDENDYSSRKGSKRSKRQLGLEDLLPFDEEDLEEYVFDFLDGRRNATGITGLIASAVTGDTETGAAVEEIEEDADEDDR